MKKHIAIIGGGQLARMMALDGFPLGLTFSFLVEEHEDTRCVNNLGTIVVRKKDATAEELFNALGKPEILTVEKEHVDIPLLRAFEPLCDVHPNPNALEKFKNRLTEKQFLQSLGIPLAPYAEIKTREDLEKAIGTLNKPIFLKTQEEGYDGYNQYKITDDNAEEVLNSITFPGAWVAESFINFEREVSFLAARKADNSIEIYPPVQNYHKNGTLLTSLAPAPDMSQEQLDNAEQYLSAILSTLDYVGLICMECFLCGDKLLVNEIAPRVHNSGHWTSKGAHTSQFENHLRAITGLPLGSAHAEEISGLLNLLGVTLTPEQACDKYSYLTLYGKTVRPRRKLGHVTVKGKTYNDVITRLKALEKLAYSE